MPLLTLQIMFLNLMSDGCPAVALAREPIPDEVRCEVGDLEFGRTYLIPKPFDPRLRDRVSNAVATAAVESGATKPLSA